MEHYDSDKAARVWQRVRGETQPERPTELVELAGLAAEESALAVLYRQMAKHQPELIRMSRDCGRASAILRGICAFQEQQPGKAVPAAVNSRNWLRLCYGRTLRCMGEYEKLAGHPEYGCAFRHLAEAKREQACRLLELAGAGK